MSDLDQLREVGRLVRQPAFEELLETRRRRTRRLRLATASAVAAAVVVAVGALAVTGGNVRTERPPVAPSPSPTPEERFQIPAGQQTIVPDIRAGDVHGFDVLATVTNSQAAHRDDSELSATVTIHAADSLSTYCRATPDLWFFYDIGDGGGGYGRCSPRADTTLPPGVDIDELGGPPSSPEPRTVRMWIARRPAAFLECQASGAGDCPSLADVPPVISPDAEFGFRIYQHQAPAVLRLLEDAGNGEPFDLAALSSVDGTAWLLDRAVVAGPDAERLAFALPASDRDHLVDVYAGISPHLERCRTQHADELPDIASTDSHVYQAAFDKICGADLRLVVDGSAVGPDKDPQASGHYQELGARLSPGIDHQVAVEVVRGDPRNIQYAVVVRTRTELP